MNFLNTLNTLNTLRDRITSVFQNPTVSPQAPAGGVPRQKLSPAANAEFESISARIPKNLEEGVRIWRDTGESPADEQWSSRLVSFFLNKGLPQLAMETANITCTKTLIVDSGIEAGFLEGMRSCCPSLETLTVREMNRGHTTNGLEQFLRTDTGFASLELSLTHDAAIGPIVGALQSNSAVKDVTIHFAAYGDWAKDVAAALRANTSIESLSIVKASAREIALPDDSARGSAEIDKEAVEALSTAITEHTILKSLQLDVPTGVSAAPLALALKNRSMDRLTLRGDPADMQDIVAVIDRGELRVKDLVLQETARGGDYSGFIKTLCEVVKSSPDVESLHIKSRGLQLCVNRMRKAIAQSNLLGLHLESVESFYRQFSQANIETLLAGLRLNSRLCAFTVTGATEAQQDEIQKLMDANRMPGAVRLAIGHGFANVVGHPYLMPVDAGAVMVSHLTGMETQRLALLNHGMHQASMQGRLIALLQQSDFHGITALCQRWSDNLIGLDQSVIHEVLYVAQRSGVQGGNKAAQAKAAREVLQAIVEAKRNGVAAYVPSGEMLAQLAQLASEAKDQALFVLVEDLF